MHYCACYKESKNDVLCVTLLFLSQLGAKGLKYLNCLHDQFVTSAAVTAADCVDTETR